MTRDNYDLIIIGGSAAGITAGIYAARRRLKFLVIAKDFGGEVTTSGEIENWPGIIHTDGFTLAQQFKAHLDSYEPDIVEGPLVSGIERQMDGTFAVRTDDSQEHRTEAVIIATGIRPRTLDVPGEKELRMKGVSYCTTCDGPLFRDKVVATIGGGNSALESALMLADIATKVYLINKNPKFKGEQVLVEKVQTNSKIKVIYAAMTTEVLGEGFVRGLRYKDQAGAEHELEVQGIFVHIGQTPNSGLAPADVAKDSFGQIKVSANCETSVPGLFAAGDVTDVPFKQIIISAGQGCIAALAAVQYINRLQ